MIKRFIDLIASAVGLLLLLPIFAIIAIAIRLNSPGPVFFLQTRCGLRGREFRIFKFRTMDSRVEGPKITVGNDPRITGIGHFLRKYKLDELPQLINVLRGEMALVGPRPEVPEYMEYYSKAQKDKVLSVRPGITDLASLEFSNENELLAGAKDPLNFYINCIMPKKYDLYVRYIDERSVFLDMKILFLTFAKIFARAK